MLELLIVKGGWVMVPILALSIYALAVIFYKIYQFRQLGVFARGFVDPVLHLVHRGAYEEAESLLSQQKSPLASVMKRAVELLPGEELRKETKEAEVARVGSGEIRRMETHLRGLEMTYSAAPLLGLLGTVLGMVTAFSKLAAVGSRVDPSILAGGIWEALITTVAGLVVAVPALIAYYWFDSVVERMRANMQDAATQILSLQDVLHPQEQPMMQAPMMVPPTRMSAPKAHYVKPTAPRVKPAMRQATHRADEDLSAFEEEEAQDVASTPKKKRASNKIDDDRLSLFALPPQEEQKKEFSKNNKAMAAKVVEKVSKSAPEEAPAPAVRDEGRIAKKEVSTLHLLSPTYTKF